MTSEQFCYWLQGLLEDGRNKSLDEAQTKMIRDHLATVFLNVAGNPDLLKKLLEEAVKQPQELVIPSLPRRAARWDEYFDRSDTLIC